MDPKEWTHPLQEAQDEYAAAMQDAVRAVEELVRQGRQDRAAGLAVGVDLGTSAAFLFALGDQNYRDATRVIRGCIDIAFREDD
jgi:Ethanolamine utilization protein EutJ (predicted chaperonin)